MKLSIRRRYATVLISVIALLGQLLLPTVHAQMWAKQNGNPLLAAFCGEASPALIALLQKNTPPELLKQTASAGRSDQPKLAKSFCSLCVSLHAGHLAGGAPHNLPDIAGSAAEHIAAIIADAPQVMRVMPPQLRGPPERS